MKPKERDQWGKLREKGMLKYVLLHGVVMYGMPMFVLMTFVLHNSKRPVALSAAIWLVAGAFYGVATWLVQEHRYRKAASDTRGRDGGS